MTVHQYSRISIFMIVLLSSSLCISDFCFLVSGYSLVQEPQTFYVSLSGNNENPGTVDQPWRTPSYGVSQLDAGDTLIILAGEYHLDGALHFETSANNEAPITLKGQNAILNAGGLSNDYANRDAIFLDYVDYINIENITVLDAPRSGIRISWSNHVTITNSTFGSNGKWGIFSDFSDHTIIDSCETYGSGEEHGIYLSNSGDYPIVRNCLVHDNYASGIQFNADPLMGGDGIISNGLIESNYVYRNGDGGGAAINLASVRDSVVQNNLLFDNAAGGIACWDDGNEGTNYGCKDNIFVNNLVTFEEGVGRSALQMIEGSTGNIALNNILIAGDSGDYALEIDATSSITSDYNIFYHLESIDIIWNDEQGITLDDWQELSNDLHSSLFEPSILFQNYLLDNYHHANESPAIDMGTENYAPVRDIDGFPRPYNEEVDIGPYEYSPFGSSTAPYDSTTSSKIPTDLPLTNLYVGLILLGVLCTLAWFHYKR
ncbi:MAG: DUF1565 domain-containing protein [Candidatus Lokiarchaeota archaeon]|nr:DUF1565 domain-containing protein [Candidatus Lokiarchaeota archaeon]